MRFIGKMLSAIIILAVVLVGAALFFLWPVVPVRAPEQPPARDVMAFLEKIVTDTADADVDLSVLTLRCDARLTAAQLEQLLDFWYAEADGETRGKIEGYSLIAREGYAELYVKARLLPVLSGQVRLDIVPHYSDGRLRLEVISTHAGRLEIPLEWVVGYLAGDQAMPAALEFPVELPDPLRLDDLAISPDGARITLSARFGSAEDLAALGRALGVTP